MGPKPEQDPALPSGAQKADTEQVSPAKNRNPILMQAQFKHKDAWVKHKTQKNFKEPKVKF